LSLQHGNSPQKCLATPLSTLSLRVPSEYSTPLRLEPLIHADFRFLTREINTLGTTHTPRPATRTPASHPRTKLRSHFLIRSIILNQNWISARIGQTKLETQ
ncbi:unnamed protein product, partial [Ectocarpus sp. 12 AP-2014]